MHSDVTHIDDITWQRVSENTVWLLSDTNSLTYDIQRMFPTVLPTYYYSIHQREGENDVEQFICLYKDEYHFITTVK